MMLIAQNDGMLRLIILLGYLALLLVLGFIASRWSRGTKGDYLLASHSIGPVLLLLTLFGTTMTAFALVGSSAEAYTNGIGVYGQLASASGIVHSLCFFMIGTRLYQFGRRHGYTTQIQFFRDRLGSDLIGLLLFPIIVGLLIPYLLIGVVGGGLVISVMTAGAFPESWSWIPEGGGLPNWLGSLVICLVVLAYVFMGGMRGTTWVNAFQTSVFVILGMVTFYLLAMKLGGGDSLYESVVNLNEQLDETKSSRAAMSQTVFFSYMFVPLSVAMFPHVFQHWLTARSVNTFKLPVVMHPIFIMLVWAPCVLIGVWGTIAFSEPVAANKVLPILVATQIGPLVSGLLSAGILAAIMSSLDSQFLCLGSMFTNDIVTHYSRHDRFSDRTQLWIARGFIVAVVAVTFGLSLVFNSRSIFDMAIWCFSGYAGLFPVVVAALYWRRLTAAGALSGILAMFGSWLYLFWDSGWASNSSYALKIYEGVLLLPVVAIFLCSLLAMVITTYLTRPPEEKILKRFFEDTPTT